MLIQQSLENARSGLENGCALPIEAGERLPSTRGVPMLDARSRARSCAATLITAKLTARHFSFDTNSVAAAEACAIPGQRQLTRALLPLATSAATDASHRCSEYSVHTVCVYERPPPLVLLGSDPRPRLSFSKNVTPGRAARSPAIRADRRTGGEGAYSIGERSRRD